jgi:hypothetical protein
VITTRRVWSASPVALIALVVAAAAVASTDTNQKVFEKQWTGRRVLLKQTLYSLVYHERGRGGEPHLGRSGLMVVTPFTGTYFQFDGRRHVDDVVEHDLQKMISSVRVAYRKDRVLDEGWVQDIDPVLVERYEPGGELLVRVARVERDVVRLELVKTAGTGDEGVTSLTVKWPLILSKSFSERGNVEALIEQFLARRE